MQAVDRFRLLLMLCLLLPFVQLRAQSENPTTLGGYGNAFFINDHNAHLSTVRFERFVLFVGHSFDKSISLFSELEIEDAKVSGGADGGEIALEQAYLKFDLDARQYLVAGLFTPRIGILNENHLPNAFNGNERTQVETYIIPATWRELGVGYYGSGGPLPLNYSLAIVNGLNSAAFEHGNVIREGRYEGKHASANSLALTGSVQFSRDHLTSQVSAYYGGSVGLSANEADSLHLPSGVFGAPVVIAEANVQFSMDGFAAKILGAVVSIPNAEEITNAYQNNTPKGAYGVYAEASYNLLQGVQSANSCELVLFGRYETLDMNSSIPSNGIKDETLRQQHVVAGIRYLPTQNVAVKVDARFVTTGDENPLLPVNSNPSAPAYQTTNTMFTLGLGFSF